MTEKAKERAYTIAARSVGLLQSWFTPAQCKMVSQIADTILTRLGYGGRVFVCGNGGCAALAQHFAAECVGSFKDRNRPPWPVYALTADSAVTTAISNDYGQSKVFARQIESLVGPQDILICLSTSGTSANVVEAAKLAKKADCEVIAMVGTHQSPLAEVADQVLVFGPGPVPVVQEAFSMACHIIVDLMELVWTSKR